MMNYLNCKYKNVIILPTINTIWASPEKRLLLLHCKLIVSKVNGWFFSTTYDAIKVFFPIVLTHMKKMIIIISKNTHTIQTKQVLNAHAITFANLRPVS